MHVIYNQIVCVFVMLDRGENMQRNRRHWARRYAGRHSALQSDTILNKDQTCAADVTIFETPSSVTGAVSDPEINVEPNKVIAGRST
jgi:hypothetical protein